MAVPLGDTEPYYDLGDYHRSVDTSSPQAQVWFDRGLVWAYAFNHEEAIVCFERALALDADLGIARWGIAYAIGPNYNKAWEAFDPIDLAASLARARMELKSWSTYGLLWVPMRKVTGKPRRTRAAPIHSQLPKWALMHTMPLPLARAASSRSRPSNSKKLSKRARSRAGR